MNIPLDRQLRRPHSRVTADPVQEATVVAMGAMLSAIFFDSAATPGNRLGAEQSGQPVPRPFLTARLGLQTGGDRHLLLVPQPVRTVFAQSMLLRLDGRPIAEIDPAWLQPPEQDLSALVAQLSEQGLQRLLRVLLTTGASLFTGAAQQGLAQTVAQLLDLCAIPGLRPVARTEFLGRTLLSYPVPAARAPSEAVALLRDRLLKLPDLEAAAEGDLLHVLLPAGLSSARVVLFAGALLSLGGADSSTRRLSLRGWLDGRSRGCRDWLFARLAGPSGEALRREMSADAVEPQISIRHLSATPAGILFAIELQDPSSLVQQVRLDCAGQRAAVAALPRTDGAAMMLGHAALAAEPGQPCRIWLELNSGQLRHANDTSLAAYDGGVPTAFEAAWASGIDAVTPLAHARASLGRAAPALTVEHFGVVRPGKRRGAALRIVTSVGTSSDMIRARAAMILAEGAGSPVEIVCTIPEGPQAAAARQAVAQASAIYGIPHRLVLLPDRASAGEALYAALSQASDAPALVLGHDVLPDAPGWLGFWLGRLCRREALAPALLATDGSIAATQAGDDPSRGLPAACLPPSGRRIVRPLAGCVALGRAGIARLLAGGAPHPDPAVWLASALGGRARTETQHPFRRYGPGAAQGGFAAALADAEFHLNAKVRG